MPVRLQQSSKVLFIGDSITDCGRREDPEGLGNGYVRLIRDLLLVDHPAEAPATFINVGISGNKVTNLKDRWQADVIAHAPNVLSVKVGINDVWHGLGGRNAGVSISEFESIYDELLTVVRAELPECQLVLCEPSVIWAPQPAEGNDIVKTYVLAVQGLAGKFGASLVSLHEAFETARAQRPEIAWAPDGVHPSSAGHLLIARRWLRDTGLAEAGSV